MHGGRPVGRVLARPVQGNAREHDPSAWSTPLAAHRFFRIRPLSLSVTLLAAGGCAEDSPVGTDDADFPATLELVAGGLATPVFVTQAPGDADRLFALERGGAIRVIRGGETLATPFLDLSGTVSTGGERGLLGLAFHPGFSGNGWFFVDYTDESGDVVVERYAVSGDPDVADPGSGLEILRVEQPAANHNGGMVAFGPDGYLYVALGDGGGDREAAQDLSSLLGTILRLDVGASTADQPYGIPPDNPFVGTEGAREEIWANGLRNPWRFSFDRQTGDLYIADVGEDELEEVNVQPASSGGGENYGWPILEGSECFGTAGGCSTSGLVLPVYEYPHVGEACSVTGGYVYRGSALPELQGRYFFGDFCGGWVRSFRAQGGAAEDVQEHRSHLSPGGNVFSFGQDLAGELYVVTGEAVHRMVPR